MVGVGLSAALHTAVAGRLSNFLGFLGRAVERDPGGVGCFLLYFLWGWL